MKNKILPIPLLLITAMQVNAQSIAPQESTEVCLGVDMVFTVTIPAIMAITFYSNR